MSSSEDIILRGQAAQKEILRRLAKLDTMPYEVYADDTLMAAFIKRRYAMSFAQWCMDFVPGTQEVQVRLGEDVLHTMTWEKAWKPDPAGIQPGEE